MNIPSSKECNNGDSNGGLLSSQTHQKYFHRRLYNIIKGHCKTMWERMPSPVN